MFKRILLLLALFSLFYLSSTSQILVSEPGTWMNGQHRDPTSDIRHVFNENSVFFDTYFEEVDTIDQLGFEFFIRKFFHVFGYSALSLLVLWNIWRIRFRFPLAFFLTALTSFLDELNQFTTFGRSGRLWDVCLDSFAVLFTLTTFFVFYQLLRLFRYVRKEKPKKNF